MYTPNLLIKSQLPTLLFSLDPPPVSWNVVVVLGEVATSSSNNHIVDGVAVNSDPMKGVFRSKCANRVGVHVKPVSIYRLRRLRDLRNEMQTRASVQGSELDAYIVTSFDDHQSEFVAEEDKRRQWLTGFNGTNGDLAITMLKSAIWTDDRFLQQADAELDCDWVNIVFVLYEPFNIYNSCIIISLCIYKYLAALPDGRLPLVGPVGGQ